MTEVKENSGLKERVANPELEKFREKTRWVLSATEQMVGSITGVSDSMRAEKVGLFAKREMHDDQTVRLRDAVVATAGMVNQALLIDLDPTTPLEEARVSLDLNRISMNYGTDVVMGEHFPGWMVRALGTSVSNVQQADIKLEDGTSKKFYPSKIEGMMFVVVSPSDGRTSFELVGKNLAEKEIKSSQKPQAA